MDNRLTLNQPWIRHFKLQPQSGISKLPQSLVNGRCPKYFGKGKFPESYLPGIWD